MTSSILVASACSNSKQNSSRSWRHNTVRNLILVILSILSVKLTRITSWNRVLTFGDLSANDRNLISTKRNIFDQMDTDLKNQTRSTTDSQKNENSTERFEFEKQTNIVTDKESKSSLELIELNSKNSALSDKWNNWREISSRSTLNFPDLHKL